MKSQRGTLTVFQPWGDTKPNPLDTEYQEHKKGCLSENGVPYSLPLLS